MSVSRTHRLEGLEPENLLAFLALLGLLRCLEAARPDWRVRVQWDSATPPTRPLLTLQKPATAMDVTTAALRGCEELARDYEFGGEPQVNWPAPEARVRLENARRAARPEDRGHIDVLSALLSDRATTAGNAVVPTPLCLMFGQGRQFFLERLEKAPRLRPFMQYQGRKRLGRRTPLQTMYLALFVPWLRVDRGPTFRWDPHEDRRGALRAANTQTERILTVQGANALAALGLSVLTTVPVTQRGYIRLQTIGMRWTRGFYEITWPIWQRALSLTALRVLLTHPTLCDARPRVADLHPYGVQELRRATRIEVGRYGYLNITPAVAL